MLSSELADDIVVRCDVVAEDLEALRRDASDLDLNEFLARAQDWAANRGDEELLRMKADNQALEKAARERGTFDPATRETMRRLEHEQWVHIFGPERKPVTVDLQSHMEIRESGDRLRGWKGPEAGLLEMYRRLDERLELLEAALDFMSAEVDRRAWAEEDLAQGR